MACAGIPAHQGRTRRRHDPAQGAQRAQRLNGRAHLQQRHTRQRCRVGQGRGAVPLPRRRQLLLHEHHHLRANRHVACLFGGCARLPGGRDDCAAAELRRRADLRQDSHRRRAARGVGRARYPRRHGQRSNEAGGTGNRAAAAGAPLCAGRRPAAAWIHARARTLRGCGSRFQAPLHRLGVMVGHDALDVADARAPSSRQCRQSYRAAPRAPA